MNLAGQEADRMARWMDREQHRQAIEAFLAVCDELDAAREHPVSS